MRLSPLGNTMGCNDSSVHTAPRHAATPCLAVQNFRCLKCSASAWNIEAPEHLATVTLEGTMRCSRCGTHHPIRLGIPRFVSDKNYANSFGYQWNIYRRTQLDSFTGVPVSRRRLFDSTGWSMNLRGERILEAGSGAGRFTEVLLDSGAEVFSFDYSNAVEANASNNGHRSNLTLFQADIFDIPVPPGEFDKVICLGVLQHTPDPEKALKSLAKYVRPGGQLVVDCYRKHVSAVLQWKYVLRPITRRMDKTLLHRIIRRAVPALLPVSSALRRLGGRVAVRLVPILDYSNLGLPEPISAEWSILDTLDMYSPIHDHPQTSRTLHRWCVEAGLENVEVFRGGVGYVVRASRPVSG